MDRELEGWEFSNREGGAWRWHRVARNGEMRIPSERAFELLEDCVEDARLRGFVGFDSIGMAFTPPAPPAS